MEKVKNQDMKTVLVTGGAGYIGSHACVELLLSSYEVVVIDNLCNSSKASLERVAVITGKAPNFYLADIRDKSALERSFLRPLHRFGYTFCGAEGGRRIRLHASTLL